MEDVIFCYFLKNLTDYAALHRTYCQDIDGLLTHWADDRLDSPVCFNEYVNGFFLPEVNTGARELLQTLNRHRISFKDYILRLMKKNGVQNHPSVTACLEGQNAFRESEDVTEEQVEDAKKKAINDSLGVELDLDGMSGEDLDGLLVKASSDGGNSSGDGSEAKKDVAKALLGNEDLDMDGVSDEDLDRIIAKTSSISEGVDYIKSRGLDRWTMVERLQKAFGFSRKEAESVIG